MEENQTLDKIKKAIGITGNFQDETLLFYIGEVKHFMKSAGVQESVIDSDASLGIIAVGVLDLWNYGSGSIKLSSYFVQRVIQLAAQKETTSDVETE